MLSTLHGSHFLLRSKLSNREAVKGCFCFNSKQWPTYIYALFMLIISMNSVTCIHCSREQCMHVTLLTVAGYTVPVRPVPAKPFPVQSLKCIEPGPTQ